MASLITRLFTFVITLTLVALLVWKVIVPTLNTEILGGKNLKTFHAEKDDQIEMKIGEEIKLESLRQAVIPPYVMILPYLELPVGIEMVHEEALDEDGIHGMLYKIKANSRASGEIVLGFKDLRTKEITHKKTIRILAE